MSESPQSTVASTPPATAAMAQSRSGGTEPGKPDAMSCAVEGLDFTVASGATRGAYGEDGRPYERQPGDPVYRPLRIFSVDPSASRLDGAEALVNVPYEPLKPGPVGELFEVDDYDSTQGTHWGRANLDDPTTLIRNGYAPSVAEPRFHQQMVYAVCSTVYASFRRALGRHIAWGFDRPARPGETGTLKLRVRPHAFVGRNAFYDRQSGELCFGYFRAADAAKGRILPQGVVFTCLSHDIVAHEVTHALLDGLRTHFSVPTGPDVLAFHEAFADLIALFQHFSYREVVQAAIRRSRGRLASAVFLTDIAQEFGQASGSARALRSAVEEMDDRNHSPQLYDPTAEPHEMGLVLVRALFEAYVTLFIRKTQRYFRLASGGTGELPPGDLPADLQMVLAEEASKLASQFLSICIRAIDYCPPVDIELGEYLRALVTADFDLVPDDHWGYREALIDAFARRRIYPPAVSSLAEESLRWQKPALSVGEIVELSFAKLQFAGDPAWPAGADELRRQAKALGEVLGCTRNHGQFGLARAGDPGLGGDHVDLPCVQSIRTSRRIGPDGQIVFDLVAEITQRRHVGGYTKGGFAFYGGATVIIGPRGELRYVIAKSVLNERRLQRQRAFLHSEAGARLWRVEGGRMEPRPNMFQLLCPQH